MTTITERHQRNEEALQRCEEVIGRGLGTFLEVGAALLEIKTGELYRKGNSCFYRTFDEYCRERWQMSARQANREILAARTAKLITNGDAAAAMTGPIGPAPKSESQARALGKLVENPAAVRRVWGDAVAAAGGGQPTAAQVAEARQQYETGRERAGHPTPESEQIIARDQAATEQQRQDRVQRTDLRWVEADGKLGHAVRDVRRVVDLAREVEFTPEHKELLAESLGQVKAIIALAEIALTGTTEIDWDAELAKIGAAS